MVFVVFRRLKGFGVAREFPKLEVDAFSEKCFDLTQARRSTASPACDLALDGTLLVLQKLKPSTSGVDLGYILHITSDSK